LECLTYSHHGTEPPRSLSEVIDRIEAMREELLSIQRSLGKIDFNNGAEYWPAVDPQLRSEPAR
jgi:hypothetical protein